MPSARQPSLHASRRVWLAQYMIVSASLRSAYAGIAHGEDDTVPVTPWTTEDEYRRTLDLRAPGTSGVSEESKLDQVCLIQHFSSGYSGYSHLA